jgi:hypothetical protein
VGGIAASMVALVRFLPQTPPPPPTTTTKTAAAAATTKQPRQFQTVQGPTIISGGDLSLLLVDSV